ncbi:hypothetical protein LA329_10980 [Corynebacterium falsenii]|uniref:hypothetical protein n=1 Tax=Corynebacterium falsenii TaxID=108486 RepID=UPI001CC93A7C|nr:hypothetical protein [Corynebacterium falsenii]UBI06739.1 hypothetical protein LA329_10980 [Corynebacterium falsenii]
MSPSDNAEMDKLQTLRTILGSPEARKVYDRELSDPTVTTLGVRRLREIASSVTETTSDASSYAQSTEQSHPWEQSYQTQAAAPSSTTTASSQAVPSTGVSVNIDFSKFAITEHRSRSSSLMWALGWGWIFLGWLYLLLIVLTSGGDSSSSYSLTQEAVQMTAVVAVTGFAFVNTVAMLVFLQLVWNIRYLVGRRRARSNPEPVA